MQPPTMERANYNVLLLTSILLKEARVLNETLKEAVADLKRESIARDLVPKMFPGALERSALESAFTRSNTDELIGETLEPHNTDELIGETLEPQHNTDELIGETFDDPSRVAGKRSRSDQGQGKRKRRRHFRFRMQNLYETATWNSDGSATFLVSNIREQNNDIRNPVASMRKRMRSYNFSIRTVEDSWVVEHEDLNFSNWRKGLFNF
jgi:hypothetical protein